jgi:predicted O-linked N-acetylglucosamine transferase (SPINDLY family)
MRTPRCGGGGVGGGRAQVPPIADGHHSYANALAAQGKHERAAEAYRTANRLAPEKDSLYENLGLTLADLCDWHGYAELKARLARLAKEGRAGRGMALLSMLLWDSASLHRRCAELAARTYSRGEKAPPSLKPRARKSARIRIAYVSADFRRHPIARLTAGRAQPDRPAARGDRRAASGREHRCTGEERGLTVQQRGGWARQRLTAPTD